MIGCPLISTAPASITFWITLREKSGYRLDRYESIRLPTIRALTTNSEGVAESSGGMGRVVSVMHVEVGSRIVPDPPDPVQGPDPDGLLSWMNLSVARDSGQPVGCAESRGAHRLRRPSGGSPRSARPLPRKSGTEPDQRLAEPGNKDDVQGENRDALTPTHDPAQAQSR